MIQVMNIKKIGFVGVIGVFAISGAVLLAVQKSHVSNSNSGLDKKTAGIVGQHKVSLTEVKVAAAASQINNADALSCLMDKYLYTDLASRLNIDVASASKNSTLADGTMINGQLACNYRNNLEQIVKSAFSNQFSGTIVSANFDKNIGFIGRNDTSNPEAGRDARYASDKAYAKNFIDSQYAKVQSGTLTIEQAAKIEVDDTRIGQKTLFSNVHSGIFDTNADVSQTNYYAQLFKNNAVIAAAIKLRAGELSPILTLSTPTSNSDNPVFVESQYIFFKLDKAPSQTKGVFEAEISNQKAKGFVSAKL